MRKILKLIKKYFGKIMTISGVGIFTYNVFNFSYKTATKGLASLPALGNTQIEGVAYYYTSDVLFRLAISSMLFVSGILIIKNKKN